MNEKQVKLNEFVIAFEEKSPLIPFSATAVKATFMKKHPEASVLSILKLASPLSMHMWSISYRIQILNFKFKFQIQIQIQNSLLLPIYIVLIIYDDMDTMYMYFSGTIS